MSDVIKLGKRPVNISAYSSSDVVFKSSEEQEKENIQSVLHNQYLKGFSEGQEAVKEKLEREFNEKLLMKYAELNNLLSDLDDSALQLNSKFEQLVMEAGFVIASAILKREIERESIFKDVLDESLRKVLGANEIIVRLHPKDYESIVLEGKTFQLKDSFSQIKFEKDERIEPGGCFIESEIGNADGRIESQLAELKKRIDAGFNTQQ